jgi:hypothetical protein
MLHPRKKSREKGEGREIRDLTTLLPSIMITYLPLAPSPLYLFVKLSVSMGCTIPNGSTQ